MEIFKLFGSIFVDSDKANESLDKTDKKGIGVAETIGSVVGKAAMIGTAVVAGAGVAIGGLTALANKTSETAKQIDKFSQATGTTTEEYQKLDYVFKKNGYSMETAAGDFAALGEKAMDAANGAGEGAEIFGLLGINVKDAGGKLKSQGQIFDETIKALQKMEDVTKRNAIASALLGTTGEELVPILNMTGEEYDNLKNKASDLGIVMSKDAIDAGVKLGNTMADVKETFGAVGNQLGVIVMPIILKFAELILENMPAIQGAINGVIDFIKNLVDWVKTWFTQSETDLTGVQSLFMNMFEAIKGFIVAFIEFAKVFWEKYGTEITAIVQFYADYLSAIFSTAIKLITDIFNIFAAIFSGDWDALWKGLSDFFYDIFYGLAEILSAAFGIVGGIFDIWLANFKTSWENIWGGISSFFSGIWDGMVKGVKDNVNTVIWLVNKMIGAINGMSFDIPDWVPELGGKSFGFDIPSIPMLAKGGKITRSGDVLVGENGPEILTLNAGAKVTPLDKTNGINIIINYPTFYDQTGIEKVSNGIVSRLRMAGVTP